MELNEIKKALYKQKPVASLIYIKKNIAYYTATIVHENRSTSVVRFEIPVDDMGEAEFSTLMDAKLLIRWII